MKAKMKRGQKPPEAGDYECQRCKGRFKVDNKNDLICPSCGNATLNELVPVYMENDPEEEEMYSKSDWQAGD